MMDLQALLLRTYESEVRPDVFTDGTPCYFAEIPDLPGCVGYGTTREDAEDALDRARVAYIIYHHRHGLEVPVPRQRSAYQWSATSVVREAAVDVVADSTAGCVVT